MNTLEKIYAEKLLRIKAIKLQPDAQVKGLEGCNLMALIFSSLAA